MPAGISAPFELSSINEPGEHQRSQAAWTNNGENNLVETTQLSKRKATIAIISAGCSTLLSSIVNGMFTVEIPSIALDVHLSQDLLLWPQSVVSLVSACTLLLAGSISDVVGSRQVYLAGTFLQTMFILGVSLARTGAQILVFRALMGLAQSLCWTSSVSIIVGTFPEGKLRNVGFACMGGGQPLGFSLGLVLAGVLTQSLGWRFGLYLVTGINAAVLVMAVFDVRDHMTTTLHAVFNGLRKSIDWIGLFIASASLAMLCYVLANMAIDAYNIKSASNIALLSASVILMLAFASWMRYQVSRERPALIPNSLWRERVFSSICLGVFFTWASFYSLEQLLSLWLQLVQKNSPFQTSIRFLPSTIVGVAVNAATGLFVHRFPVLWVVVIATGISLSAPILMGVSGPSWIYWAAAFPAISLNVVGPDVLYTVANLLISDRFPNDAQGLTGGVFNTVSQVGKSVGLALSAVIANTVSMKDSSTKDFDRLASGYKAGFWFCVALSAVTLWVCLWGLWNVGRVGVKRD